MNQQKINNILEKFEQYMKEKGKSNNTIMKYMVDVKQLLDYVNHEEQNSGAGKVEDPADRDEDRGTVLLSSAKDCATNMVIESATEQIFSDRRILAEYKEYMGQKYLPSTANSKISAINYFLNWLDLPQFTVRHFQVQKSIFRSEEKHLTREEYLKLMKQAKKKHDIRLYLIMETLASSGLRISELQFVTVETIRARLVIIHMKGKVRTVLLPDRLCRRLSEYAMHKGIRSGSLFITRNGNPVNRSNILHEMKNLCPKAGISASKVFPHNLRHLFAVTYYEKQKDVCHLADILGHSNINTTRIYTSMSIDEYRRNLEELGLMMEE